MAIYRLFRCGLVILAGISLSGVLIGCPSDTFTLTTGVSPSGGGEVFVDPLMDEYEEGTIVSIEAVPATGYIFDHWTGAVANANSAVTTTTMNAERNVTAIFLSENDPSLNTYTLTVSAWPSEAGEVFVDPEESNYAEGTIVTLEALPLDGWMFDHWTGEVNSPNSLVTTLTMDANRNISAIFVDDGRSSTR